MKLDTEEERVSSMSKLVKVSGEVVAVGAVVKEAASLANPVASDIVVKANELRDIIKEQEKVLAEYKEQFFALADEINGEGNPFTLYDADSGYKLVRQVGYRGGDEVDDTKLLKALCEHFGEELTDRKGKAWTLFKSISEEHALPRKVVAERLATAIENAQRVEAGVVRAGSLTVPSEILMSAVTPPKKVLSFKPAKLSKKESEAARKGELG